MPSIMELEQAVNAAEVVADAVTDQTDDTVAANNYDAAADALEALGNALSAAADDLMNNAQDEQDHRVAAQKYREAAEKFNEAARRRLEAAERYQEAGKHEDAGNQLEGAASNFLEASDNFHHASGESEQGQDADGATTNRASSATATQNARAERANAAKAFKKAADQAMREGREAAQLQLWDIACADFTKARTLYWSEFASYTLIGWNTSAALARERWNRANDALQNAKESRNKAYYGSKVPDCLKDIPFPDEAEATVGYDKDRLSCAG